MSCCNITPGREASDVTANIALHSRVEAAGSRAQDSLSAAATPAGARIVLADGAGGLSGGLEASEMIVAALSREPGAASPEGWERRLRCLDRALLDHPAAGWSTAVVLSLTNGAIQGASVGDSGAWLFTAEAMIELTAGQRRKPLLGTDRAEPRGFEAHLREGERILIASDGLLKYTEVADLWIDSLEPALEEGARRMIDRVRLRSGALRDDVSLALIRRSVA